MKNQLASPTTAFLFILFITVILSCHQQEQQDAGATTKQFDTAQTASMAAKIDSLVKPELGDSSL
ncbi:MAG: hypothetical protein INR73_29390, partial [Williamsia sp.]|nr:hypothetical protein [Williamsia sp.]